MSKLILPGKPKEPHEAYAEAADEVMQRAMRRIMSLRDAHGVSHGVALMLTMPLILSLVRAMIDETPDASQRDQYKLLAAWPFVRDLDRKVVMQMILNGGVINVEASDVPDQTQH